MHTPSRNITSNKYLAENGIQWVFTPIGDAHFNGYAERHLGILKSIMRKSVKVKLLTLDQLLTVACYAQAIFNERPLCVLDNSDVDFVPLTPNTLVFGRNMRQFVHMPSDSEEADPEFVLSHKSCIVQHKKLKSTLAAVRKIWYAEYLGFLARKDASRQKGAPSTKNMIQPRVNDWVLIKDNTKEMRIGKILKLLESEYDGEIRKVILKTKNSEGVYPVTNLRYLENHPSNDIQVVKPPAKEEVKGRPKRHAAQAARTKIANMADQ